MAIKTDNPTDEARKNRIGQALATLIEDLQTSGELSDQELQAVAGGAGNIKVAYTTTGDKIVYMTTYRQEANSSTFNNDQDYTTVRDESGPEVR